MSTKHTRKVRGISLPVALDSRLREMRKSGINVSAFVTAAIRAKLSGDRTIQSDLTEMKIMLARLSEER